MNADQIVVFLQTAVTLSCVFVIPGLVVLSLLNAILRVGHRGAK